MTGSAFSGADSAALAGAGNACFVVSAFSAFSAFASFFFWRFYSFSLASSISTFLPIPVAAALSLSIRPWRDFSSSAYSCALAAAFSIFFLLCLASFLDSFSSGVFFSFYAGAAGATGVAAGAAAAAAS